jgi:O-antigen ligase
MIEYLPELVIWILLAMPIFYIGLRSDMVLPITVTLLLLGFFLMMRIKARIFDSWPNRLFAIFLLIMLALLPFSISVINSLPTLFWFFACFGVFIYSQWAIQDSASLIRMLGVFVFFAVAFSVDAVIIFIKTGLTSYTRLESYWGLHNLYAGFLLIPFFVSIAFVLQDYKGKWRKEQKACCVLVAAFLFAAIVLTFSRGAWLCIALSAVVVGIFFGRELFGRLEKHRQIALGRKTFLMIGAVVLAGLAIIGAIWLSAKHTNEVKITQTQTQTQTQSITQTGVFLDQDSDDNAFTARLHYFNDAYHIFLERPLVGWGLETYTDALNQYKTIPGFYSSDPHNILFRMFAEVGVFGATAFAVLIISLLYSLFLLLRQYVVLYKHDESWNISLLYTLLFAAIFASALHSLMDIDWHYYPLLLVFFACAGGLYGSLKKSQPPQDLYQENYFPIWSNYIFVGIFFVIMLISLQLYRAENAAEDGNFYVSNQKYSAAVQSYSVAIAQNPYQSGYWFGLGKAYYSQGDYLNSEKSLDKAIILYPYDGDYYASRADVDTAIDDKADFHKTILKTLQFFNSNLDNYVNLVGFDIQEKDYAEASAVANYIVPIYTTYEKALWFKDDPASQQDILDLKLLEAYQGLLKDQNLLKK